jgi:hypothetical protein
MRKIIQTSLAAALVTAAALAGTGAAQAGFLSKIVKEVTTPGTLVSNPRDNPEVQAEIDYYEQAEQDEIDYLSRDSRAETEYLNRDAQSEIDYYNSFNK